MYKLISYYRAVTSYSYPANARIIQVTPCEYALYICHDRVGTVKYMRGALPDIEKALFSFNPGGYGFPPVFWKKVQTNGN